MNKAKFKELTQREPNKCARPGCNATINRKATFCQLHNPSRRSGGNWRKKKHLLDGRYVYDA